MAYAANIPMISILNDDMVRDFSRPMRTSVFPDLLESAIVLVSFLLHLERTDFIAFLYPLTDKGMQRRSALGVMLDSNNVRWMASEYVDSVATTKIKQKEGKLGADDVLNARTVRTAVKRIKQSGFRTVVISLDLNYERMFEEIADAIEEFGMNDGEHFFVFLEPIGLSDYDIDSNVNIRKLITGSAFVLPLSDDTYWIGNPLIEDWSRLGEPTLNEKLNFLNPIEPASPAYMRAESRLFEIDIDKPETQPEYGSGMLLE